MWTFLGSDVMFFGAFIATYLVYRGKSLVGPYPNEILNIPITSVSTFVLLMSSFAMVLALHYVKEGKKGLGSFWIWSVVVLGAIFIGFQVVEFTEFACVSVDEGYNQALVCPVNYEITEVLFDN